MAAGQTKTYKIQLKRKTRVALAKDADKKLAATVKLTPRTPPASPPRVEQEAQPEG